MKQRLEALRKEMELKGLSYFIVTKFENFEQSHIRYLCGFTGSNAVLVVSQKDAFFITDGRYTNQANEQIEGAKVITYKGGKSISEAFIKAIKENKDIQLKGKIGIESKETSAEFFLFLERSFPEIKVVELENFVLNLSLVRSEYEQDCIREAVAKTDIVFNEILPLIKPGVSEKDLAAEISFRHIKHGAEKDSFEPIVASGPRSALPHGIASDRRIETGDFITFDIGCFFKGYASDFTRTVVVGEPTARQVGIYETVKKAQRAAVAAAGPGVKCLDLDSVARKIISDAGYGVNFTHSLGHGLGHYVHGLPVLSAKSPHVLEPGNVITIEPGIYITGYGGVRIEDDVIITAEGSEELSKLTRELIVV